MKNTDSTGETKAEDRLAALNLVDVRVLDHFVVSAGECVSFDQRGLL